MQNVKNKIKESEMVLFEHSIFQPLYYYHYFVVAVVAVVVVFLVNGAFYELKLLMSIY